MDNTNKGWILNLTQHKATPEQIAAGVIDLPDIYREQLSALLTFEEMPTSAEVQARAEQVAAFAVGLWAEWEEGRAPNQAHLSECAMIGGAPYLMAPLERALIEAEFAPVYAFSRRETVEETLPDGSVKKTGVFRHLGFVEVSP